MTLGLVKPIVAVVCVILLSLSVAGCRQPDGPIPTPQGETLNRLGDLSRDLMSAARGDVQAKADFADDLRVFAKTRGGEQATRAWALKIGDAVTNNTTLNDQSAQQLAHTSWTIVGATELSDRQVETLRNDVKAQLTALGIAEDQSEGVAGQVPEVHKAVSTRSRRWYEMF